MDGILNLSKPQGLTSHDVVNRVRTIAKQRKVGHAGTLDPMATGVLLVCLGRATRVSEYLMTSRKTYRARIRLGATTDTYDAEGTVLQEHPVTIDLPEIKRALHPFRGPILQIPPMYSALKRGGQPLYRLARQGVTVEREPRPVEIHRLDLITWQSPELVLEVTCSSGTYIRSLAHDLGQALGCGAHLTGLVRLASGDFQLAEAIPLADLTRENLSALLLPLDTGLSQYPPFYLDEKGALAVRSGRAVPGPPPQDQTLSRAYDPDGTFLALLEYRSEHKHWHPHKVFAPLEQ